MREPRDNSEKGASSLTKNMRLLYWAAGLSIFALVAHAIDAPDHLREWWGYATFFVVAASLQFFYGWALLLQPWRYDDTGGVRSDADRTGRPYYFLGIILNALVIAVYIVSRTVGIPFLGPEAAVEPVTPLSLVPIAVDIPLMYCLVALVRSTRVGSQKHPSVSS